MDWPASAKRSAIGLDIGSHSLKAAQLVRRSGQWKLESAISLARTNPDAALSVADLSRFRDVLDRRGFVGRDVIIAVPPPLLMSTIMELPARTPGIPLEQIARAEFARVHELDASTLTISTWDLPAPARASKATYMMGAGAVSESLEAHLAMIEDAGFRVTAVDDPASAAARTCTRPAKPGGLTAVLDWGWSSVNLIILQRGLILYVRRLAEAGLSTLRTACIQSLDDNAELVDLALTHPALGSQIGDELAGLAEVNDALSSHLSDLCREIQQAIGYVSHQYSDASDTSMVLTGGGALITGAADRIASLTGLDGRTGRPAVDDGGEKTPADERLLPVITTAVGLAGFQDLEVPR
jgi:Tfp pilus assembly PilM family ATPase